MSDPIKTCPACGKRMRITHTRPLSTLIERRRRCTSCDRADVALSEPEKILHVRCVDTQDNPRNDKQSA